MLFLLHLAALLYGAFGLFYYKLMRSGADNELTLPYWMQSVEGMYPTFTFAVDNDEQRSTAFTKGYAMSAAIMLYSARYLFTRHRG